MTNPLRLRHALLALASLGFAALPLRAQIAPTIYFLDAAGQLITAQAKSGATPSSPLGITGTVADDVLVAIDVRPQNQRLYALGVNSTADTLRIYHLQPETGVATPIGNPVQFTTDGTQVVDVLNTNWDIDFNPAVDRLRVVTSDGLNFRMNPNTGAGVDGDLGGAAGSVPGLNMDAAINGAAGPILGVAYTNNEPQNNFTTSTSTTLHTFDGTTIYIQNPPNSGTQSGHVAQRFNVANVRGFDIPPGVNVNSSNQGANGGKGYYCSQTDTGTQFWEKEFDISTIGDPVFLFEITGVFPRSMCVRTGLDAFVALDGDGNTLRRFRPLTPGDTVTATLSNVFTGETIVAMAGRPQTGQLFGFGVNETANTGTLYILDPQTGAASAVGTPGQIAFVDAAAAAVDLPAAGTGYGMDFNPTVDRIRIVTGSGLNFRLNPNTGAAVDGDLGGAAGSVAGVNPDGALNGGATVATATAYTNSVAQTLPGTATTQYSFNSRTGNFYIQNPPNAGTLNFAFSLSMFDFFAPAALDIPSNVSVANSGSAANGAAWLLAGRPGFTQMFRVDLGTGTGQAFGGFFAGSQAAGLVAWSAAPNLTVEQPAGTALTSGSEVSFGTTLGASATRTFTLRNSGSQPLTYSAQTIFTGGLYQILSNASGTIAAGGSTTLEVAYMPLAVGAEEGDLFIVSDDTVTPNFAINLTGPGALGLTADEVVTTSGETRLNPLANDGLAGTPTISAVSDGMITFSGRTLILPAGYTGTFTYTVTDGASYTAVGSVTATAGTAATAPTRFNGLLTDATGKVSGWADVSVSATGVSVARVLVGASKATKKLTFPDGMNTVSGTVNFGTPAAAATIDLDRATAGVVKVTFTTAAAAVFTGTLHAAAAPVLAVEKHHIALASIDSAIPGGGFAIATISKRNAVKLVGVLPDGHAISARTTRTDDGGIAFFAVDKRSKPAATYGGSFTPADLAKTDVTGELVWTKPAQLPTVRGLHLAALDTVLTANGSAFTGLAPLLSGTGTLKLTGGNLAAAETNAAIVSTLGIPAVPTASLTAWTGVKQKVGKFNAKVLVPTLTKPVSGRGIYLPKANRAWGFFPGTTVGGRIELTVP